MFSASSVVNKTKLILASASPRRKEILATFGIPFDIAVADVIEHEHPDTDPRQLVAHNAALKADAVACLHPDALVLGADTTVFIDKQSLNKPRDLAEARAMLRKLSGRTHTVFTGLALRQAAAGIKIDDGVASEVTFKNLSDADIDAYLSRVNTLDKAGGYAIQEHGEMIVARHTGSLTNIIGLPVERTKELLTQCGFAEL